MQGGEYKSEVFDRLLKEKGIRIIQSAPHTPQMNGRAERFICTMMDKEASMHHEACLPESWWEFTVTHACKGNSGARGHEGLTGQWRESEVSDIARRRTLYYSPGQWRESEEIKGGFPPCLGHLHILASTCKT